MSNHLENISCGDFSVDIPKQYLNIKDEVGAIARSVDLMQKNISKLLTEVHGMVGSVDSSLIIPPGVVSVTYPRAVEGDVEGR